VREITINVVALLVVVGGDVGRCSLVTARCCLPASLVWVKHDHLVAAGVLSGDVARHVECVPEEVTMLASEQAPFAVLMLGPRLPWRAWRRAYALT
jgi:hypothetical protein